MAKEYRQWHHLDRCDWTSWSRLANMEWYFMGVHNFIHHPSCQYRYYQ